MKVCLRCGVPLGKKQQKWCVECGFIIGRELSRARQKARVAGLPPKKKSPARRANDEHMEWEADICLNCERAKCTNCLSLKSVEEREKLLKESGGKKWLN